MAAILTVHDAIFNKLLLVNTGILAEILTMYLMGSLSMFQSLSSWGRGNKLS